MPPRGRRVRLLQDARRDDGAGVHLAVRLRDADAAERDAEEEPGALNEH